MNTANTKERTITVNKKDVFFDIDFLSLKYSEGSSEDDIIRADRVATETQDTGGNRIVTRLCDHRVSDLRQVLRKFIKSTTSSSATNTLNNAMNWVFTIVISNEAEDNTIATLGDLFHDYIVSGAAADYYIHVGRPGNTESLRKRADDDLARIRELIYYRPMP